MRLLLSLHVPLSCASCKLHKGLTLRDDERGYQLYQSDPSGNYGGWKATAIGANYQGAQNLLKQEYKEEVSLHEAIQLVMKVCNASFEHNGQRQSCIPELLDLTCGNGIGTQ